MRRVFLWGVGAVVLVAVLAAGYRQFVLIPKARQVVLSQLSDPSSAQFRNDAYFGMPEKGEWFYCGQVNAKNALGGYVGFSAFSASDTSVKISAYPGTPDALCEMQIRLRAWWEVW